MDGTGIFFHPPPPRTPLDPGEGWITPIEKMLVVCVVLLIISMVGFAAWTSEQINQNNRTTLDNRAVGCRLMRSMGISISTGSGNEPCDTPAIKAYLARHPDDVTRINHDQALCAVAAQVQVPSKELRHLCGSKNHGG